MFSLSQIKRLINDNPTKYLRIAFYLWCAYEVAHGLITVLWRTRRLSYDGFEISDWMINYQGGFVRRGITGEVLFQLYQLHPYSLSMAIYIIISLMFIALLFLLYRLFKRNGWSYILFPSCVLVVQSFTHSAFGTRKDYILLLGAYLVFMLYRQWFDKKATVWSYMAMQTTAALLMLIHEATMFFTVPILFYDYFTRQRCQPFSGSLVRSTTRSLLCFLPTIGVWAAVCISKGDEDIASAIWQSWQPAMEAYPMPNATGKIGASVDWLGNTFFTAARFHLIINFGGWFIKHLLPALPFTLYCYVAIYYVVTRMQTVNLKLNNLKTIDTIALSNILLVQFVFMSPMFTVLSCDCSRTVPYWIVSSLFIYHFFGKSLQFPDKLTCLSTRIQAWIDSKPLLNNPWAYFVIIILIPLPQFGHSTITCYYPLQVVIRILKYIYYNYML